MLHFLPLALRPEVVQVSTRQQRTLEPALTSDALYHLAARIYNGDQFPKFAEHLSALRTLKADK